jgi:hypothetical protein
MFVTSYFAARAAKPFCDDCILDMPLSIQSHDKRQKARLLRRFTQDTRASAWNPHGISISHRPDYIF